MAGKKLTEAQEAARLAILRDVERSGGQDRWSHLHSHGHRFTQVVACINRGDLIERQAYHYEITPAGRAALNRKEGENA